MKRTKKKRAARYKRTKKATVLKRKLRMKLRRHGITRTELKTLDKIEDFRLRGILSDKDLKDTRTYFK